MTRCPRDKSIASVMITSVLSLTAASGLVGPVPAVADCGRAEVIVKLRPGRTVAEVVSAYPVERGAALLTSHSLFLLRATDPAYCADFDGADKLADRVEDHPAVLFAESELRADLSDGRFHAWPDGDPEDAGSEPVAWSRQLVVSQLRLPDAHRVTRGAGSVVAVLDTGVDTSHPALANRLLPGYDYVDDDTVPAEATDQVDGDGDGAVDESYGHGTFVAGTIALVAPEAKILPMRTLDSDGTGNAVVVAEAVADAVTAGADVINLAFGTPNKPMSNTLEEAIKRARERGVLVVVSAGNEGSRAESYPAAQSECLGVGAQTADGKRLADFSNRGSWVDVAAPGSAVVGPFPGGRYVRWSGTSVAAPVVSAQALLVTTARPNLAVDKVSDAIVKSSTLLKPSRSDELYAVNIPRSLVQSV